MLTASRAEPVTFLFTDIEGSTSLWERAEEAMREALASHDRLLTDAIQAARGRIVKSRGEGDSIFAVFAQAVDALAAAASIQARLGATGWPGGVELRVRAAVHSGTAEERDGDFYGPHVNRCARLRSLAAGGQVLVSAATAELVAEALPAGLVLTDIGEHTLRGFSLPERVFQLWAPGMRREFGGVAPPPGNLPRLLTEFVGRTRELEELASLVGRNRLLVLTGFGGAGKTRLGLELAAAQAAGFPDGAWLIELADLEDPRLVEQRTAEVLGIREQPGVDIRAALIAHLRSRRCLLLVDNCEHLLDACAEFVERILASCPGVKVLATSREPLGIAGESTWDLPPLPPAESMALFRARAGDPADLPAEDLTAIDTICRRLDGIPLAIELAAARTRAMSPTQILSRLDDRFGLLTASARRGSARHQSLRTTIDWSCRLLAPDERALFEGLSVFDGFTLEAAEAVFGEAATADVVGRLLDRSLLIREGDARDRYRLLQPIRAYAAELLEGRADRLEIERRHAEHFWQLAAAHAKGEPALLEADIDNLRSALRWCQTADPTLGIRLASALGPFWPQRGFIAEGRRWLRTFIDAAPVGTPGLALAHHELGWLAIWQADDDTAIGVFRASLEQARAEGSTELAGRATNALAFVHLQLGENREATRLVEAAIPELRRAGDPVPLAQALYYLVLAELGSASREVQLERLAECRDLFARAGSTADVGMTDIEVATQHLLARDVEPARIALRAALDVRRRLLDLVHLSTTLEATAGVAWLTGRPQPALRLLEAAASLREDLGIRIPPQFGQVVVKPIRDGCLALLGEQAAAMAQGPALSPAEAIAFAIAVNDAEPPY